MDPQTQALFSNHYAGYRMSRPQSGFSFQIGLKNAPSPQAAEQMRQHLETQLKENPSLKDLSVARSQENPNQLLVRGQGSSETVGTILNGIEQQAGYKKPAQGPYTVRQHGM